VTPGGYVGFQDAVTFDGTAAGIAELEATRRVSAHNGGNVQVLEIMGDSLRVLGTDRSETQ
jgi:hypothetical protein